MKVSIKRKSITLVFAIPLLLAGCSVKSIPVAPVSENEKCPYWCPSDNINKPVDFDKNGCPVC